MEEIDTIYPSYKDLKICCNTIINSRKYQFDDILTDAEYELLINSAKLILENFEKYKNNFVQKVIDDL